MAANLFQELLKNEKLRQHNKGKELDFNNIDKITSSITFSIAKVSHHMKKGGGDSLKIDSRANGDYLSPRQARASMKDAKKRAASV